MVLYGGGILSSSHSLCWGDMVSTEDECNIDLLDPEEENLRCTLVRMVQLGCLEDYHGADSGEHTSREESDDDKESDYSGWMFEGNLRSSVMLLVWQLTVMLMK